VAKPNQFITTAVLCAPHELKYFYGSVISVVLVRIINFDRRYWYNDTV